MGTGDRFVPHMVNEAVLFVYWKIKLFPECIVSFLDELCCVDRRVFFAFPIHLIKTAPKNVPQKHRSIRAILKKFFRGDAPKNILDFFFLIQVYCHGKGRA